MSCVDACCLLLRGQVFIQAPGQLPRSVGNASRLSIAHVNNDIIPLDGSLSACDPLDAVTISLTMKCADLVNLKLGLQGQGTNTSTSTVTDTFALPSVLEPGHLLPFSQVADVESVSVIHDWLNTANGQKFRKGYEYTVTPVGLEIERCVTVPTVSPSNSTIQVKYKTINATRTDAGEHNQQDVKLIYSGVNQFDGSPAVLVVPQVRFSPIQSVELINDAEIELTIDGDVIRQSTSPNWYSISRPYSGC